MGSEQGTTADIEAARAHLTTLMERYRCSELVGISSSAFRAELDALMGLTDAGMENYQDPARQRDLSIRFHWGHNHDFGDFTLPGRMGDRHLWLLSHYIGMFRALPRDLTGARVLDIGCWTGGTSLLLAAMGAEVVAIEEVRKYVAAVELLKTAFAVDRLTVHAMSLYECAGSEFHDRFDYVLFAGVIYHLTDPVLGCRIAFNALTDGGRCMVETMAVPTDGRKLDYLGPDVTTGGKASALNRGGWNWFVPSPFVLKQMLLDAGFASVDAPNDLINHRAMAVATRDRHRDINRAGLSVPNIR